MLDNGVDLVQADEVVWFPSAQRKFGGRCHSGDEQVGSACTCCFVAAGDDSRVDPP
jgi:hypothetical protein